RVALPLDRGFDVRGARQRVIHERAGDELAFLVVARALHQALADALHHAAVHLALGHERVQHRAEVVHRAVAHHLYLARLRVALDLARVAAVRERRGNYLGHVLHAEPPRILARELHDADGAVRSRDREAPLISHYVELDVRRRRLQRLGRRLLAFLDDEL